MLKIKIAISLIALLLNSCQQFGTRTCLATNVIGYSKRGDKIFSAFTYGAESKCPYIVKLSKTKVIISDSRCHGFGEDSSEWSIYEADSIVTKDTLINY